MKRIKVYVAGKISKESVFGTPYWRDGFCKELSEKTGFEIINLDPTKKPEGFDLDQSNSRLVVGRNCFLIKSADIVIVNLTDDISVGGSQEMLIAKYYRNPLVGIAPKGGKFNKKEKEVLGRVYKNFLDPFVLVSCDKIVENIDELSVFIKEFHSEDRRKAKDITVLDYSLEYYLKEHRSSDKIPGD